MERLRQGMGGFIGANSDDLIGSLLEYADRAEEEEEDMHHLRYALRDQYMQHRLARHAAMWGGSVEAQQWADMARRYNF